MVKKVLKTPLTSWSTICFEDPDLGSSSMTTLVLGRPMKPLVKSAAFVAVLEINWQVLSTSHELFSLAKSDGPKMLVRVTTLEMTSSRLLTRVVEALKKVVK